jgi:nicotinate-nucleotide adenylyltransferase
MRIGLFFGSFNPVHIGHLALAQYLLNQSDLDEIWFVLSPQNPHKQKESLLDGHARLEMLHLALRDSPNMRPCDIELYLPKPSYTIDTLTHLREKYKHDFVLLIGEDNLQSLHKWKNATHLVETTPVYVYPRLAHAQTADNIIETHWAESSKQFQFFADAPVFSLSSSFIRHTVKQKKDFMFYLPLPVYQYVFDKGYYS